MPLISLIVSILNPPELTANFLNWQTDTLNADDIELVIVCDGDSNIRTHQLLRDAKTVFQNLRVIFQNSSTGYAAANNVAAKEARGDVLVFLNSDTFPIRGAIRRLATLVRSDERVGIAQGLLIYPQTLRVQSAGHIFGAYFNQHALVGRPVGAAIVKLPADRQALTSAFYAVRQTTFFDNNGFDEFYLNAFEGMEFSLRVNLGGYRCIYVPESIAYHIQGSARRYQSIDETQQIARFWSMWGGRIQQDLDGILAAQIGPMIKKRKHLIVNTSNNRNWMRSLETLDLRGDEVASFVPSRKLSLQEFLVPEIHQANSPILFLTDHFSQISENLLWFSSRVERGDLILDCHGNVITMSELLSELPEPIVYP